MKTEDFVAQVRKSVVESNLDSYRDLFQNTTSATDPYWIRALSLYKAVDDEEKNVLLEIMRQVIIDSVSSLFAIVDGVTEREGQDGSVRLLCGQDELSGELQDRVLQQFED